MLKSIKILDIVDIAKSAGDIIMKIYEKDFSVSYKDDNSPLTEADLKSNDLIVEALKKYNLPIMSEEMQIPSFQDRKDWEYYWCIDPIDGTKEFVKKNGEFTVNIALIHKSKPVLGVVYAPVLDDIYYAKQGEGAFKNGVKLPLIVNKTPQISLKLAVSRSHLSHETKVFIKEIEKTTKNLTLISKGSSLKLVMVAEGSVDIYPRMAPTMEWDTAAAHAIVLESDKDIFNYHTNISIIYNKKDLLNPWFIVR